MVNEEWQTLPVDKIKADTHNAIAIGPFGSRMKAELYRPYGIPVIRGNNISKSKQFTKDFVFISEETASQLQSSVVFPKDLVFPHRGAIGEVGIVPDNGPKKFILSSSLMKLTCNTEVVDPLFLFYFFRSSLGRQELLKNASTVGTPGIATPLSSLRSIEVPIPPLIEQQNIARTLGSLDDKIELNRQMNETLEAMARAIFQSWFVDFDPVRAKAEGHDTGLTSEVAALFSSEFEEVDGREMPKGWRIGSISDLSGITSGQRPENRESNATTEKPIPLYGGGGVMGYVATPLFQQSILLTGRVGTLGEIFRITSPCWASDNTLIIIPTVSEFYEYLYYQLRSFDFNSLNRGSTQPLVTQNDMKAQEILIPTQDILKQYHQIVKSLFEKIDKNDEQSRTLAQIRDALLPKLISGEIILNV